MRVHPVLAAAWRQPARAALWAPSGLTARRFVDLGRTKSMMCHPYAY
jgi:hypothetical protein